MDEETVVDEATEPMCPVCGNQIDLVESRVRNCDEGHWSKAKRLAKME